MQRINVEKLVKAIAGTDGYTAPILREEGTKYIYERIYMPMAAGESLRLRDIDYNAFKLEDVGDFAAYYNATIYDHCCKVYNLSEKLRKAAPFASAARFI